MKPGTTTLYRIILVASLIFLAGCNIPANGVVAPSTIDQNAVQATVNAVQTQSVKDALVQLTMAAALTPSAAPTEAATEAPQDTATTAPTNTEVPPTVPPTSIPSLTPVKTSTPVPTNTNVVVIAPTVVPTQGEYQCAITALSPAAGWQVSPGNDFDMNVTFKNVGTKTWTASDIDFRYLNGVKFQKRVDALDLSKDVATGEKISMVVDMLATTDTGSKSATWGLVRSDTVFCYVSIRINVK
jgi:hypothetical protein